MPELEEGAVLRTTVLKPMRAACQCMGMKALAIVFQCDRETIDSIYALGCPIHDPSCRGSQ